MIKINKANASQTSEIKELLNYVWIDTYKESFSKEAIKFITEEAQTIERLKFEIEDGKILFLIAQNNSKEIVGLTTAKREENKIFLQRLYIHPNHQREGIGLELLSNVISNYKDAEKMYLEAEENNFKGINFYKKNGFEVIRKNEYELIGEKFSTLLMEKSIYTYKKVR